MKPIFSIVATSLIVSVAEGCVRAHTDTVYDLIAGDSMYIQIWDNNVQVCKYVVGKKLASTNTQWCIDQNSGCKPGYRACFWNNGKTGTYWNDNAGYQGALSLQDGNDTKFNSYDCLCTENHCSKCTEYESCLTDNFGNCGSYPKCKRCDFRGFC